jgi:hypothetical protein
VRTMSKAVAWIPVQVKTETAIRGGVGRKQHVLDIEQFEFEDREASFVQVSPNEGWLCNIIAGQCASRRPLSRSDIFKRLRDGLAPAVADSISDGAAQDDRMHDLGFDDSPSSSPSPPAKIQKRSRASSYKGATVRKVTVPASPAVVPAVAADREVLAAIKSNKIYIEVDALSWLVCFLRCEFEAGFVPPVESAPAAVEDTPGGAKLWWDFRDECWVGRERPIPSSDKRRRQRKSVRSRMAEGGDLHHMAFEDAKAFCYAELAASLGIDEPAAVADGAVAVMP